MSEPSRPVRKKLPADVPVYTRLPREVWEELHRRAEASASTVAGQIRLLVCAALQAKKGTVK